jgi:RNA polymerase sigma-70 factor (ECF subfamily)
MPLPLHPEPIGAHGAVNAARPLAPERLADHRTALYRAARAMRADHHDAEDLVQDAFVRALSRPRTVRGAEAYLRRTLRNLVLDRRRAAAVRPAKVVTSEWDAVADRRADPHAVHLLSGELVAAIADLPDRLRHVLVAVDVTGLTYEETARVLAVPQGTVMSRLFRARARVAEALAS